MSDEHDGWLSDDELEEVMKLESSIYGREVSAETSIKASKQILEMNAPAAANAIISIAKHGTNDNVRLRAAQYILDRTLGPISQQKAPTKDVDAPLEAALQQLMGNAQGPTPHS